MKTLIGLAVASAIGGAAFGSAAALAAPAAMMTGNDARAICLNIEKPANIEGLICAAWINGAVQGAVDTISLNGNKPEYCEPKGIPISQYSAIFVKYLNDNPDKLHLPSIFLFHQAIAKSFPCVSR